MTESVAIIAFAISITCLFALCLINIPDHESGLGTSIGE